jgi:hypothetical protein
MKRDLITNAEIDRKGGVNPTVTWILTEIGWLKPYDKLGRSNLYRVDDVITCFENSPSEYLRCGAERLRQATQKE